MAKWGYIVHLNGNLEEDVYKSRVCVLTSQLDIILEVVKISVDDTFFPIRVKEASRWDPSFSCDFSITKDGEDDGHVQNEEGSNDFLNEKDEDTNYPF